MSMTLWASYQLDADTTIHDESDKSTMLQYMEALDTLCETLKIPPLSGMINYSDLANDFLEDDDFLDEVDEDNLEHLRADDESQNWIHPRDALHILDNLLEALNQADIQFEAPTDILHKIQSDLQECIQTANMALEQCERFCLTLVS